jgi:hypothetical protein
MGEIIGETPDSTAFDEDMLTYYRKNGLGKTLGIPYK